MRLPETLERCFSAYRWPGNVRELENVVERVVVLARGNQVEYEDLPSALRSLPMTTASIMPELPVDGIRLEDLEKDLIVKALIKTDWNQTRAAQYLGLSRKTLIYRMEKHGISRETHGAN